MLKHEIRRLFLQKRKALSEQEKKDFNQQIRIHFESFLPFLKEQISRKTRKPWSTMHRNRTLFNVKRFMSYLEKMDHIMSDPSKEVEGFKKEKTLPRNILSGISMSRIFRRKKGK